MQQPILSDRGKATAIGCGAVLLWASLATLTVLAGDVPAFEMTAITFAVGGGLGLLVTMARKRLSMLVPPMPVLVLGVAGLFGEHVLYFGALRSAPPSQAGLIVALWPLIMVVLSATMLREKLRINHALGVLLGLSGVSILTMGSHETLSFELRYVTGYLLALGAAAVWAGYSVMSRKYAEVPTESVVSFCLLTAILAATAHFGLEQTVTLDLRQALAVLAMGIGPVGLAFFVWDHGVKHGNIRVLGVISYAAPILSTLTLVVAGLAAPTPRLSIACFMIALAALVATSTGIDGVYELVHSVRTRGRRRRRLMNLH